MLLLFLDILLELNEKDATDTCYLASVNQTDWLTEADAAGVTETLPYEKSRSFENPRDAPQVTLTQQIVNKPSIGPPSQTPFGFSG